MDSQHRARDVRNPSGGKSIRQPDTDRLLPFLTSERADKTFGGKWP